MRKSLQIVLAIGLLLGFDLNGGPFVKKAAAANSESMISDIVGQHTYLMDNGTLWSQMDGYWMIRTPGSLTSIAGDDYGGLALSKDGQLMEWGIGTGPRPIAGQTDVKQVVDGYWLKTDSTVWLGSKKVKGLDGVSMIGYGVDENRFKSLAVLTRTGDLILVGHYSGKDLKLGTITDVNSVKSMSVTYGRVALLFNSGQVVVYEDANFDDNGTIIPVTIAQDADHIAYTSGDPDSTDILLVTRKNGTLWQTGKYQARWKLDHEISGLGTVVKTAPYTDYKHFYVKRSDNSWVLYDDEEIKPVDVPNVQQVDVSISELKPFVGESLKLNIQETYSNGAKIKVAPTASNVSVDKPHLLELQPDGRFKVLGVGQIQVTVTTGGYTKSLTVSASLQNNLTFAKLVNGNIFVPAKAVIQALGGSVTPSNGNFEARIGDATFSFKAGNPSAKINGETVSLKAAPLTEKGELYIPGELLTAASGAKVQWDGKWQTAEISFGEAKMTVVSTDTAALVKKAMQGSLAKYIGRSYWINHYEDWERFSKVTVTDILPEASGNFVVVFKSATGKTIKTSPTISSFVSEQFTDEYYLFSYDPKKKYRWSESTWNQIKAGKVSLGMTKDQVKLSWGYPASTSITSARGNKIETWVYRNFDAVSFINGKVAFILT
ncbi:stalk domain-containing protein [Cohnella mopanensis]|uniref:stalk domain-containing protein n=1 Tax=Cohnella mopanensis TaxID=2911966 RepID=UPI001EF7FE28|nr:copper amine oxidase N-terminal domain-containing protein [Cohnella mopanensis]